MILMVKSVIFYGKRLPGYTLFLFGVYGRMDRFGTIHFNNKIWIFCGCPNHGYNFCIKVLKLCILEFDFYFCEGNLWRFSFSNRLDYCFWRFFLNFPLQIYRKNIFTSPRTTLWFYKIELSSKEWAPKKQFDWCQ